VRESIEKRSTLAPRRRYLTTAFTPMSLSSARTGPFRINTVVPDGHADREREVMIIHKS